MAARRFTRGRGLVVLMAIIVTAMVVATQGCCSSCEFNRSGPVSHTIALGENMEVYTYTCGATKCVCPVPKSVAVRPGDEVRFVNTSDCDVRIKPSLAIFTIPGEFVVASKKMEVKTVVDPIPSSFGAGIGTDIFVDDPNCAPCEGLPGPTIDFD